MRRYLGVSLYLLTLPSDKTIVEAMYKIRFENREEKDAAKPLPSPLQGIIPND